MVFFVSQKKHSLSVFPPYSYYSHPVHVTARQFLSLAPPNVPMKKGPCRALFHVRRYIRTERSTSSHRRILTRDKEGELIHPVLG